MAADFGGSLPAQHPCTLPCHAPASCDEAEPCGATVTASCPCGRIRQDARCGARVQIRCGPECAVARRNARLAEALGISVEREGRDQVVYPEDVGLFGRANGGFVGVVERAFEE